MQDYYCLTQTALHTFTLITTSHPLWFILKADKNNTLVSMNILR